MNSSEAKFAWVKENYPDFESIQNVYSQALSEAENLDETEEAFTIFMDKYDALYFPLVDEDAGFYIPMSDLDAAFLTNPNGEVKIGGEIRNLKDISNYNQLFSLGRTYYNEGAPLLADAYTEFTYKPSMTKIGQTYESGWRVNSDNDRKINLKIDRQLQEIKGVPTYTASRSVLHIEISFRKKTWLGWSNYSSETNIKGNINYGGVSPFPLNESQSGNSSHDLWHDLPIKLSHETGYYVATFPIVSSNDIKIAYRGFSTELSYSFSMNGAYCKVPVAGTITPQM